MVKHLLQELCSDSSKLVDIVSCLPDSSAAAEQCSLFKIELRTNTETGYLSTFLIN